MKNIRQNIQSIIRSSPGITSRTIAQKLQLTPAAVRYHIRALQNEGLISSQPPIQLSTRGKPPTGYRICDWDPASIEIFIKSIVNMLLQCPAPLRADLTQAISQQYLEQIQFTPTKHLLTDLSALVMCLSNYQPKWLPGHTGPSIHFQYCPFSVLLSTSHGFLCEFDQLLLATAIGRQVKLESTMENNPTRTSCIFQIMV